MRWVKHVEFMGRVDLYTGFLVGIRRERRHLENIAVDGSVICLNIQYGHLLNKYLKCSIWRLAVLYDIYMTLGGKGLRCTFKKCKEWHRLD
jgi:hypothetical protein